MATLEAHLTQSLPERVSALQLAACLLGQSELAGDYPPDFSTTLVARGGQGASTRTIAEWLQATSVEGTTAGPPLTGDQTFFSLVFVCEDFAREFRHSRPSGTGFEQRCKEFTDSLTHEQKETWDQLVGIQPTTVDRRQLPALAKAIDRGGAAFTQLAEARCYQFPHFNAEEESQRTYARFYLEVLDAFEMRHGAIVEEYWCIQVPAGVVRTERGNRLHLVTTAFPHPAVALADRAEDVRQSAVEFLTEQEGSLIESSIYAVLTNIYAQVDAAVAAGKAEEMTATDLAPHAGRLNEIEAHATQRMERRAQRWYIFGTLLGLLLLSSIFGFLAAVSLGTWQQIFEGAIFGAAGALASVLFRMHRGALQLDPLQGIRLISTAALVRPLMGALFGGIVCALLLSGLLPVEVPKVDPSQFYFLGTTAFIAGFAERWAPSLLELTAAQVKPAALAAKGNP